MSDLNLHLITALAKLVDEWKDEARVQRAQSDLHELRGNASSADVAGTTARVCREHAEKVVAILAKCVQPPAAVLFDLESSVTAACLKDVGGGSMVEAVRRKQRDGSSLWRVKWLSNVLNKHGEWEYEPIPSSRDDAFIERCSWPTLDEARAAFDAACDPAGCPPYPWPRASVGQPM